MTGSGPVTHPAMRNQSSDVSSVVPLVQPTCQATSRDVTSATDSPDVHFTRPIDKPFSSNMSPALLTSVAAHFQDPNSDVEHYIEPTFSTQSMEEEGEVFNKESTKPEQDLERNVSEEQTCRETIRGMRSFMGLQKLSPL